MSFIEDSIENVKRQLMKEVSGGSVGGFVGGKGMGIDALFAGPYHPDYNEIDNILKQQLKGTVMKYNMAFPFFPKKSELKMGSEEKSCTRITFYKPIPKDFDEQYYL